MGKTDEDDLHDLDWLSGLLGVPQRTIYSWRQRGEGPPAYRIGKISATAAATLRHGSSRAATPRSNWPGDA